MEKTGVSIEILAVVVAMFLLAGCGQAATSSTAATSTVECSSGYELYDGSCILESSLVSTTSSTCISIADSISFYGSGITADSYGDLYAGLIPDSSTYGTMTVGSTTLVSGTTYSGDNEYYGGTLWVDVSSATGALSGTLNIASYEQEIIEEEASSSEYANVTYDSSPCVSGIAIQGQLYSGTTMRFTGSVYLYLNETEHGIVLSF
jgi:hypothetical protein